MALNSCTSAELCLTVAVCFASRLCGMNGPSWGPWQLRGSLETKGRGSLWKQTLENNGTHNEISPQTIRRSVLKQCAQFISSEFCCWQIMTYLGSALWCNKSQGWDAESVAVQSSAVWYVLALQLLFREIKVEGKPCAVTVLLCNIQLLYMVKFAVMQWEFSFPHNDLAACLKPRHFI